MISDGGGNDLVAGTAGQAWTFDAARAMTDVRRLAFPRRVGTRGERRAARAVARAFESAGLSVRRETFPVPLLAREVGVRLILGVAGVFAALGWVSGPAVPLAATVCWSAAALLLYAPWSIGPRVGRGPFAPVVSQNVLATLPYRGEAEAAARLVFLAHYDSKSQPLPTGIRTAVVVAGLASCCGLALGGLGAGLGLIRPPVGALPAILAATVVLSLAALALNATGDRSPGALDNATGVATLLELARTWRPRPRSPVEVWWVATGAEETGLDGARAFVGRHEGWCRSRPTLILNLDSVGAGDVLHAAGAPAALALADATAESIGLRLRRLRVIGAGMDHEPFVARGLHAMTLLGDVYRRSLDLHSRRDTIERVSPAAMARAGLLASEIGWAWAERQRSPGQGPVESTAFDVESAAH